MNKTKKFLAILVCFVMFALPVFAGYAHSDFPELSLDDEVYKFIPGEDEEYYVVDAIRVNLNGQDIDFTDDAGNVVDPQIINNRTMVPMRKIFEELGAKVEWNGNDRSIKAFKDNTEIYLQINNAKATVTENGETKEIELDSVPVIVDNRTLVPVRFIAESLGQKVGWDSWNRTVVIIDTASIEKEIAEKASNLYEFLTADYERIDTFEMSLETGLKYAQDDQSIAINADGDFKLGETAMELLGKLKLKAIGEDAKDAFEDVPNEAEGDIIFDFENGILYLKSPQLAESEYFNMPDSNKWVKIELEDEMYKELLTSYKDVYNASTEKMTLKGILDLYLEDAYMTSYTYEELKQVVECIVALLGNDNFTAKESKSQTIYTLEINNNTLVEVMNTLYKDMYTEKEIKSMLDGQTVSIKLVTTVKDNVVTSVKFDASYRQKDSSSIIEISGNLKANLDSYNQKVNITIPKEKDTVRYEDVYENPLALNTAGRAQFTGFVDKMGQLQDDIYTARTDAKIDVMLANLSSKTDAQLSNFVARGGDIESFKTEDKWLTEEEAENTVTQINKNGKIGSQICPEIRVETYSESNVEVSYGVTPEGKVYCWPPYVYAGKSYVNATTTVTDSKGNDVEGLDATKPGTVYIVFSNGEKVSVTTKTDGSYIIKLEEMYYGPTKSMFTPD